MIGTIRSISDMPDLGEMIEANNADTREDRIDGIVERVFEDWDCRLSRAEVWAYVAREVDSHGS